MGERTFQVRCGRCPLADMGLHTGSAARAMDFAHQQSWCQATLALIAIDAGGVCRWKLWASYRALERPSDPCHLHAGCGRSRWRQEAKESGL